MASFIWRQAKANVVCTCNRYTFKGTWNNSTDGDRERQMETERDWEIHIQGHMQQQLVAATK